MRHTSVRHAITGVAAASVLAGPGHAQLTLYDDFSGGIISPELWEGVSGEGSFSAPTTELIRTVQNGALSVDSSVAGSLFLR
jgi:hypothetical protein